MVHVAAFVLVLGARHQVDHCRTGAQLHQADLGEAALDVQPQHRFVERQCRGVVGVEAGRRIELEAAGSELSAAVHLRERFGEERVHAGEGEDAATLVARGLCHHPVIELR